MPDLSGHLLYRGRIPVPSCLCNYSWTVKHWYISPSSSGLPFKRKYRGNRAGRKVKERLNSGQKICSIVTLDRPPRRKAQICILSWIPNSNYHTITTARRYNPKTTTPVLSSFALWNARPFTQQEVNHRLWRNFGQETWHNGYYGNLHVLKAAVEMLSSSHILIIHSLTIKLFINQDVVPVCGARNTDKIESLKKRILRFILHDSESSYSILLDKGKSTSLYNRHLHNFLILLYKSLFFTKYPIYMRNMFSFRATSYNLRGN
jgi:hypothetical protein